jgi:hypothetical protein
MSAQKTDMVPTDRNTGHTITCVNNATVSLGVDFDKLIAALQKFLDEHFVPVWRTPAKLVKAEKPRPGTWTLMFIDDIDSAEDAGWLGLHHLEGGHPFAKVFVNAVHANHDKVSVAASHELAEMLVDPSINLWTVGPNGTMYAYEVCDAVEEEKFSVNSIPMSNFVYPTYFDLFRKRKSAQFDHMDKIDRPFQILPNGYASVRTGSKVTEKTVSKSKAKKLEEEERKDHRSEYRKVLHARKPTDTTNFKIYSAKKRRTKKARSAGRRP